MRPPLGSLGGLAQVGSLSTLSLQVPKAGVPSAWIAVDLAGAIKQVAEVPPAPEGKGMIDPVKDPAHASGVWASEPEHPAPTEVCGLGDQCEVVQRR